MSDKSLDADKLPIDQLAALDSDQGLLFLGTIPLVVVAVLAIIVVVLHFVRRGKSWNELGEAMRLEPEDEGASSAQAGFSTGELASMGDTQQSKTLTSLNTSGELPSKHKNSVP